MTDSILLLEKVDAYILNDKEQYDFQKELKIENISLSQIILPPLLQELLTD